MLPKDCTLLLPENTWVMKTLKGQHMHTPGEHAFTTPNSKINLASLKWHETQKKIPIICLHGWMDNAMSFYPLAQELQDHPLIAIELPGHGRSDHLPMASFYHLQDYLRILFEILKSYKNDYVLLGHSLGAGIASLIAGYLNPNLKNLILIEGIGPLTAKEEDAGSQLEKYLNSATKPHSKDREINDRALNHLILSRAKIGSLRKDHAELLVKRNIKNSNKS